MNDFFEDTSDTSAHAEKSSKNKKRRVKLKKNLPIEKKSKIIGKKRREENTLIPSKTVEDLMICNDCHQQEATHGKLVPRSERRCGRKSITNEKVTKREKILV